MENDKAVQLGLVLIGLALLEGNGNTYVRREIREVIEELKKELGLRK